MGVSASLHHTESLVSVVNILLRKSRIRETLNLSTNANSNTDAIGGWVIFVVVVFCCFFKLFLCVSKVFFFWGGVEKNVGGGRWVQHFCAVFRYAIFCILGA